ncbi:conserved hypothetical protein [Sphingomonas sp. EC-HK361]|uniref:hypothetical protein n=1 Tax=Sphingomonas sp. EC-HK361 TaxID=2038397 RepID=UPI001255AAC4|nr:hypothetical protein [Sphingomonas sp. EC-HK361]VVT07544.1 conserved hypothetical protein [Sphingomonas sp. EC-HK361]
MADTLKPADIATDIDATAEDAAGKFDNARQALKDNTQKFTAQAGDKARLFAEDGKTRAGGALDQLAEMLTEAAGKVDDKLGEQYGGYARSAAQGVAGFSDNLKAKSVDDLIGDMREMVRKSPAVAIGTAAALGFVLARVIGAGFDQRDKD